MNYNYYIHITLMDWSNYDQVLKKVKKNGSKLKYASEELKKNKTIVMTALNVWPDSFVFITSSELKKDKEVMLLAVQASDVTLDQASPELQDDYDIVLMAVTTNGDNLEYASERLKDNKTIVLSAVNNYGYSIRFASNRLKKDMNIMLTAINPDCSSYYFFDKYFYKLIKQNLGLNIEWVLKSKNGNNLEINKHYFDINFSFNF